MKNRTLDLNKAKLPTLVLTLQDEEQTKVTITIPSEGLISEMQSLAPDLMDTIKNGDKEGIEAVYDMAADLISCNRDFKKFTGKELREKYNMDLESAVLFFSAYMDFITDVTNEKN